MIRRICRLGCAALWLVGQALAAPPLTTIQDLLYKADGTRFNGTLTISWSSFQSPDNSAIVSQSSTVRVLNGNLRVQLVPTTTSTPPSTYTVVYQSDGRVQFQETWSVPSSAPALRVRDVRVTATTPGASGTGTAGADTSLQESSVIGLVADLAARPLKSPSLAPGRAAVVDANGMVSSAAGSASDCVHVDGSSGPCGTGAPAFVDADSPSGIVDGSNATFGLAAVPDPAASLAVYRNGMLQKSGQDFTLTGSTVHFVTGATPQPGDTLLASYRVDSDDDGAGAASLYTLTQVLCTGVGNSTNAPSLAVLGACSIPAGLLAPGDRVEIRFDYSHHGTGGGVSVEVDWGGTPMLHRDAASSETLLTGRVDAVILTTGAQVSAQSWGAVLALGTGAVNATDAYAPGLTVNFKGSVAQSGDTVSLTNFTVVRVP